MLISHVLLLTRFSFFERSRMIFSPENSLADPLSNSVILELYLYEEERLM